MNKNQIIKKVACWIGYCLFAGWSAIMTAESVSMSMDLRPVWVVFIFVFIVAIIAGFCLSGMVKEIKNKVNPNKGMFVLCLLGFLLFWGFSFATNVHYSLMRNEGLEVVKAELGNYRSYVVDASSNNKQKINDDKTVALNLLEAKVTNLADEFERECESSIREGFGPRATRILQSIEEYFTSTAAQYEDLNQYKNTIYDDDKDRGDRGTTGATRIKALEQKYALRIVDQMLRRQKAIEKFYDKQLKQLPDYADVKRFINDSLMAVDIPQLEEIATPQVYYQFQKIQFSTINQHLSSTDITNLGKTTKVSKTDNAEDIDKGKFRYRVYPSERMFNTFNVWEDMLRGRMPEGMKLFGWILFSLIVDIVAFVLRIFAR